MTPGWGETRRIVRQFYGEFVIATRMRKGGNWHSPRAATVATTVQKSKALVLASPPLSAAPEWSCYPAARPTRWSVCRCMWPKSRSRPPARFVCWSLVRSGQINPLLTECVPLAQPFRGSHQELEHLGCLPSEILCVPRKKRAPWGPSFIRTRQSYS